ncbi:MAG: hypothetical protein FDZ69_11605 [Deltaproteobacteria bacterium]|nr:MAG: hypothetical protein FDZ69_11605 [Deltaproteobacteria bacterium]
MNTYRITLIAWVVLIIFAGVANAHDMFHPNIGVFGNYSLSDRGFDGDNDGNDAWGAKVGIYAAIAGVDLGYAKSKFDLGADGKPKEVDHIDLSIYATYPDLANYLLHNINMAPYICLGTGYYDPEDGKGKIGANIGFKVISLIYEPSPGEGGFPVSFDFGGTYNYFPMDGNSITFTEIKAGITIYK